MMEAGALRARRNTIADALARAAAKFADRDILLYGDRLWTARGLDTAAGRVARWLVGLGLRRGDRVVAYGRNSDAFFLLWLGCCRAGLVHVPTNYALSSGELAVILRGCGAAALMADAELAGRGAEACAAAGVALMGGFEGAASVLDAACDERLSPFTDEEVAEGDLAQLLYTSGTTAAPKGAMMSHAALLSEYASCIVDLDIEGSDRDLAAMPLYHSAQMHVRLMPLLLRGGFTVLMQAPVTEHLLERIEAHAITSFFAPPTVIIGLLRHPDFDRRDLRSLRKITYGAAIMPLPVLEELRRRLPDVGLYNAYGQSEIGPLATVLRPEQHELRPRSAGLPALNVETRVIDAQMRDCGPGEHGEIVHRSPHLLLGYWNDQAATAEAFTGGWFHSGDIGYRDEDGFLYVVDRLKDIINTGGVTVPSREVEEALLSHAAVSEAAVIGLPDPVWIEAITAIIVLRAGAEADEAMLVAHARTRLAPYKLPKRVILVEALPRNTAGKILKRELRVRFGGAAHAVPGAG